MEISDMQPTSDDELQLMHDVEFLQSQLRAVGEPAKLVPPLHLLADVHDKYARNTQNTQNMNTPLLVRNIRKEIRQIRN